MNEKIVSRNVTLLENMRKEQLNAILSVVAVSISRKRSYHLKTNPKRDRFNIGRLECEIAYCGNTHSAIFDRMSEMETIREAVSYQSRMGELMSPYREFIGDLYRDTRVRVLGIGGRSLISILVQSSDMSPLCIYFNSLKAFALHLACERLIDGFITYEQFVFFCSDSVSSNAFRMVEKTILADVRQSGKEQDPKKEKGCGA